MKGQFYDRRQFLAGTMSTVAGVTLANWSPSSQADPEQANSVAADLTVIDTHTHFYDPTRPQGIPWPPRDDKFLYRTVLPQDYHAQPVPKPVKGTVVIEASEWLEDNQWVLDQAAHDPFIVGFMGNLPVGTKEFAGQLKRFAANELFRGLRVRERKLDGTQEAHDYLDDLKLLADHDLCLDILGGMGILPFAELLATKLPSLRIIIDHLADVRIDGKAVPTEWAAHMRSLAKKPNVYCKISGLVEATGRRDGSAPRDVEFYRPALDAMRTMFGPKRLMYGSNWPVSERFAPLATVQSIVQEYFHNFGRQEEEQVFSQTAKAAYRWVRR